MMTTPSLIERLEALESPCRECDALLHHARLNGIGTGYASNAPAYTASLDAAMTLVPEGYGWRLWVPSSTALSPMVVTMWGNGRKYAPNESTAATPAIALCIASLKAQEASNDRR